MSINNNEKIKALQLHDTDTGSSAVQIALLTERIHTLNDHLTKNPHDFAGRRGLMQMVGLRRRLTLYLQNTDMAKYRETIKLLDLRK